MTYDEYVAYLLRYLWREFDTDLEADAEFAIKAAEARLNRDLKIQRMETVTSAVLTVDDLLFTIPSTMRRISLITDDATGREVVYVLPSKLAQMRAVEPGDFVHYYTIVGRNLRFVSGISGSNTRDFIVDYFEQVPSLKDEDTSWVIDEFFDLYHVAVVVEAIPRMKSDQRYPMFEAKYKERLDSVIAEDANNVLNPTQGNMPDGVW